MKIGLVWEGAKNIPRGGGKECSSGGVKNFDQVWGEKKVSPRFFLGGQQTFKKGSQMGGTKLEPKKNCARCARKHYYINNYTFKTPKLNL